MRSVMFSVIVVLSTFQSALAGNVDVYIPNVTISPGQTTLVLPVTARLQGGDVYNVDGYVMKVNITGGSGCTFAGPATRPDSNYLLGQSDQWDGGMLTNGVWTLEQTTDMSEAIVHD